MKYGLSIVCLVLFSAMAQAQLTADFSTASYPLDPAWRGHTFAFGLENDSLLRSQTVHSTYISAPNALAHGAEWEFGLELGFNPSPSNRLRVYLVSDTDTLTAPLNGYFIQLGENGNQDRYELYKQTGQAVQLLVSSTPKNRMNPARISDRVRVVRDPSGYWELFSAIDTASAFTSEGIVWDFDHTTTAFFGVHCLFTPTNSDKFGFRYFRIDTNNATIAPPASPFLVNTVEVDMNPVLRVVFNRAVDTVSGSDPMNYTLDNGYGHPADVAVADSTATLTFDSAFVSGNYVLSVENVSDTAGVAVAVGTTMSFSYTTPPIPDTKLAPDDTTNSSFFDDFSAGLHTSWLGDTASVHILAERLRLDTNATSPTVLQAPSERLRNTVWEAGIDIDGALSSSNFVRLYLAASDDPAGAHQGYHLQIDGSSGNHSYRLWRQNGASRTSVFQSIPFANQDGKFRARVRVVCDMDGRWSIWADEHDSGIFEKLTNSAGDSVAIDLTHTSNAYLGYQTSFTSSRREDFKLDYVLVWQYEDIPEVPDPFDVESLAVQDDTTLRVIFNRVVDTVSGSNPVNYTLDNGYGNPIIVTVVDSTATLSFGSTLVSGNYVLSIENVTDTAGVAVEPGTTITFSYTAPPIPEVKLIPDDTAGSYFFDDFSTGLHTSWLGDTASVHIAAERLRLDTAATSPTVLHAPSERLRNTIWEAGIDIEGAVTGSNFVRLYLTASDDPAGPHQGYHLQIDGSSGNHTYRLWRQNGASRTSVFQSVPVPNQSGKFRARVRVICDIDGRWSIWADEYDSGLFEQLTNTTGDSSAIDLTYTNSAYFGYQTSFTASRREDFKLDYVLVRQFEDIPEVPDPFDVESLAVQDDTTLRVVFNRVVDTVSGSNPVNYTLDNGYGNPIIVTVVDSTATLSFGSTLVSGNYVLSIENVTDTAGVSVTGGTTMSFSYSAPPIPEVKLAPDDTTSSSFFDDFRYGLGESWQGDTASVHIADERLRLDTNATSPTVLHASSERVRNTVWEAGIDVDGVLTSSNYVRLYLAASDDPADAHQGYHLQIDGSSGNHTYRLWRQNGASRTSVFQSAPIVNQDGKFRARVRVICDIDGRWSIWADEYDSGLVEQLTNTTGDSSATDLTYTSSAYLGYQTSFTSSRREDFKLDYVLVRQYEDIPDTPDLLTVESLAVQDDITLRLVFNHDVDPVSGSETTNYFLDNGYGNPVAATVIDTVVELIFANPFVSGSYLLSIENVMDTAGVEIATGTTITVSYTAPPISEVKLMPDDTTNSSFFDDFSAGLHTGWQGDTASVHITDERLRLDTNAASPTVLHAPSERLRNTVWEAGIDVDGALTSSNYVRLYLAASADPAGTHQGYHLQIDGTSGNHVYRLWRQNGASRTSVFQSVPVPNQSGKFRARVRVICDIDGRWSIWADEYDSGMFEQLSNVAGDSSATDQTYSSGSYLGYQTSFTSSRREDFKLDYMLVQQHEDIPEAPDPLIAISAQVVTDTVLRVIFNRDVDPVSASETTNYFLDNGYGNPFAATVADTVVELIFANPFVSGSYLLSIENVTDTSGVAVAAGTTMSFSYTAPPIPEVKLAPDDTTNSSFFDDFRYGLGESWLGDTASVHIASERLWLDINATSPIVLHSTSERVRNTIWEAGIDIDGALTGSNYVRLYLAASDDPAGAHQGYHLQIDGSSGNHVYRLWRQNGASRTSVFQSIPFANQDGKFRARVRVVCDIDGRWSIWADEHDSGVFERLSNSAGDSVAIDLTYTSSAYLGYQTSFTASRREDFKLDYVLVQQYEDISEVPDPLIAISPQVVTDTTLRVIFNRNVDPVSASETTNYFLDNGYGHPVNVAVADLTATLTFGGAFVSGNYILSVENVTDTSGVAVEAGTTVSFSYTAPPIPEVKLAPDDTTSSSFFDDFRYGLGESWQGDTAAVHIANERLRLDINATSPTVLHSTSERVRNTIWEAGIDIDGALTGSNYVRLYLAASDDPAGAHQGYHLQIDGSSGNHVYRLWRQNGASRTSVFQSEPVANQDGKFRARVRVICDIDGVWSIWADEYDSGVFEQLTNTAGDSSTVDLAYISSVYLGYQTSFTPSRREDFKLDYALVRQYEEEVDAAFPLDTIPPAIMSVDLIDSMTVSILFDKMLASLSEPAHFSLQPGGRHPQNAVVTGDRITLVFPSPLAEGAFGLTITGVRNIDGYAMTSDTTVAVTYQAPYAAQPLDVVINEIMAHPNGASGLPEQEYIELYNRTQKTISLAGWTYQSLTTSVQLGDLSIPPGGYLILSRQADAPDFSAFGTAVGLSTWPALANNGTTLRLLNPEGLTVDEVAYLPAWYRSAQKRQGGWSLERIAPGLACLGADNWMASNDPRGGSPGVENSVFDSSMDWPLEITELQIIDNQHIRILFSKDIDILHAGQASTYQLDEGVGHPDAVEIIGPREAILRLASPLAEGMPYTLLIGAMLDCLGHPTPLSHSFFLPHSVLPGEILVNEILFNPKADGVDFVELYNYSEKTFDLQALDIANVNASGQHSGHRQLATEQILFRPHTYMVLTTSPAAVKAQYPLAVEQAFVTMPAMPAFPNAGGTAVVLSRGRTIDSLTYAPSMHAAFIVDPKGISLERDAFHVPTNAVGNFRSASTAEGGATPGYRNSSTANGNQEEGIFLTSRTFSPDQDGFEDLLEINYRFAEAGLMANVAIYDDSGTLVRRLIRNQSLPREGILTWDATADSGRLMPVGIYIALIEIYNAAGLRRLYRESFVLASRF